MSNRRKLHPHELAQKDQRRAEAKERARAGQTVIMTEYADGGQCSWCDCPVVDSAGQPLPPHTDCAGCPEPAAYVMTLAYSTPRASHYPVCETHHLRFANDMIALMRPRVLELAPPWEDATAGGGL